MRGCVYSLVNFPLTERCNSEGQTLALSDLANQVERRWAAWLIRSQGETHSESSTPGEDKEQRWAEVWE